MKASKSGAKSGFKKYIRNPFEVIEERPTPKAIYNWRIYMTAFLATTSSILIGYDSGFIGSTVANENFTKYFNIDPNSSHGETVTSNIISCFHIAAFGGALIVYPLKFWWGNKIAMLFASAFGTVGSVIMLGSISGSLAPMYLGRVMSGMAVGAATNLTIVYLSEVSPAPIRGQIVAIFEVGWRIGDLTGFWINYGVVEHIQSGEQQWVIPVAVQIIPAGLFFIGSCLLHESPRWLVQNGREEQSLKVLCWLRNLHPGDEYLDWEFRTMRESVEHQKQTIGMGMFDPMRVIWKDKKLRKRLCISSWALMLQNFMGIQSINYYSVELFKQLGQKGQNASMYASGFLGVMKFGCTAIYILFIVDTVGRRPAFLVSSAFCSAWFWYIGAYLKVANLDNGGSGDNPGGRAAIGSMYLWVASYLLAWSGGPFVWGAEVFEQNLRQFTQSVNAALSWIPIFIMAKATTSMIHSMKYGMFFFYAVIDLTGIPFVFFCVPETKGIPLESIDMLFEDGLPAWRAHRVVLARLKENQMHETENSVWGAVTADKEKEGGSSEFIEDVSHSETPSTVGKSHDVESVVSVA